MGDQLWYVLQTKPQKERVVVHLLQQAGYEVFCPTMMRAGRLIPLFPRYCFLRADIANPKHHQLVRYTRGVTRVLGDNRGPVSVKEEFVVTIRSGLGAKDILEHELLFKLGDTVRVKDGVLRDLTGIIEKNVSADGRVQILFKWLSRKMRAVISYRDLEKAA